TSAAAPISGNQVQASGATAVQFAQNTQGPPLPKAKPQTPGVQQAEQARRQRGAQLLEDLRQYSPAYEYQSRLYDQEEEFIKRCQKERWGIFDQQVTIEQDIKFLSAHSGTAEKTFDILHELGEVLEGTAGDGFGTGAALDLANEHLIEEDKAKLREI